MHDKTLAQQAALLANGELKSVELVEHYFKRIERLNPQLNAYIQVDEETALNSAKAADGSR